jgi:2-methylaconitate cis-trans-isomerase PrpF
MCLAIAARIPDSVVAERIDPARRAPGDLRVAHASGILTVAATVRETGGTVVAEEAVVYRTARRLMQGEVLIP